MNDNFKDEIQQFTSHVQRLDSKIDALQFSIKEDLKQFATKDDLNWLEEKIDLQCATKEDLFHLEERNDLRYATKDNFSQQKSDLIKWIFTFWISLAIMILGLYLKK